jgi:uncharacterized protein YecE (DUF72 family)
MAKAYIGTSGWNYKHWWNNEFYPSELRPSEWLQFFVRHFDTVEINNSFYRLPSEATFQNWRTQVPPRFTFAVKASRFVTHIKRLKDPEEPLDLFFSRAKHLQDRLGPVLFQLPPRFKVDLQRLETFLTALKKHITRRHVRCAIEVRDPTWLIAETFDLLKQYRVALCFADWHDTHVTAPVTADFVYLRRHAGTAGGGNYTKTALDRDIKETQQWLRRGLDVYIYFNNDVAGHAIRNAKYVQEALFSGGTDKRKRAADSARLQGSLKHF